MNTPKTTPKPGIDTVKHDPKVPDHNARETPAEAARRAKEKADHAAVMPVHAEDDVKATGAKAKATGASGEHVKTPEGR
jgi:hypothetical protein